MSDLIRTASAGSLELDVSDVLDGLIASDAELKQIVLDGVLNAH